LLLQAQVATCEFRFKMAETIDKRNAEPKEDKKLELDKPKR
jgi:hypothetical protein